MLGSASANRFLAVTCCLMEAYRGHRKSWPSLVHSAGTSEEADARAIHAVFACDVTALVHCETPVRFRICQLVDGGRVRAYCILGLVALFTVS